MKNKFNILVYLLITGLLLSLSFGGVVSSKVIPLSDNAKQHSQMNKSPIISIIDEEFVVAPPGLERFVFIHYAKPGTQCGNLVCEKGENKKSCPVDCGSGGDDTGGNSTCYETLGKGVVWKNFPINYVINTTNGDNLTSTFIQESVDESIDEWNTFTSVDLFGTSTIDNSATWDSSNPDGRNEVVIGNYADPGVIGVTVTWGYYSGPPRSREIVEFDILLNDSFDWGDADLDPSKMDFKNIMTHELGHGYGLGDLYTVSCDLETMYGYSTEGETIRRTLESGDKAGLNALY